MTIKPSDGLEVVGLVALVAGLYLVAGLGVALVVAGGLVLFVGLLLDVTIRPKPVDDEAAP